MPMGAWNRPAYSPGNSRVTYWCLSTGRFRPTARRVRGVNVSKCHSLGLSRHSPTATYAVVTPVTAWYNKVYGTPWKRTNAERRLSVAA